MEEDGVNTNAEVRAYEVQISSVQSKLMRSKRIVEESQVKIQNAKKELLVLWKMEINSAIYKKKETLQLPEPRRNNEPRQGRRTAERSKKTFLKIGRVSRGKHACT